MNLIQQAVARADQMERTNKLVMPPLEPVPNLGSVHSRSFRPVPLAPTRTPLAAIGLAVLALAGGAALYVALAHSRDEAAAVASVLSQVGGSAPAEVPAKPVVAAPVTAAPAAAAAAPPAVPAAATTAPANAATAAAAAAPPSDPRVETRDTIDAWARAWSARDVDAYLAFYGEGFAPERGASRASWEKARRQALDRRKNIAVTINDLKIEPVSPTRVVANYTQDYAADAYRETGTAKRLVLEREGGVWRIVAESSPGAR